MTDIVDNETGEVKTVAGTALALNTNETLAKLQKEVTEEFVTSDHEVYKEALRSLLHQEQKLQKQIAEIQSEIKGLDSAKAALDEAFRNGTLHSAQDARGIVRTVGERLARSRVDSSFDDL